MKLCVVGPGYVGLVTAACFAEMGNEVVCVGREEDPIDNLNQGIIHIYEPGLEELVKRNLKDGRLYFTDDLVAGVKNALIIFLAVGTPPKEDGSCDLSAIYQVAEQIANIINSYRIVAIKSTVPVGTSEKIAQIISQGLKKRGLNINFDVVSNPEFLKEGDAVNDFMKPDRVIIGTENVRTAEIMKELYAPFARTRDKLIVMDQRSAEMTKYAANCMLATKISFINEIANLCEHLGADVSLVRKGIGADHRIGYHFIYPGVGFGGSCFPKDLSAMIHLGETNGWNPILLKAVKEVNDRQKKRLAEKIVQYFQKKDGVKGKKIAIWGLSFKPNTNDMREAPSIDIISRLLLEGAMVEAFDPVAIPEAKKIFGDRIKYAPNAYAALEGAHALALVTEWNQFRHPDFDRMAEIMTEKVIFDGRNLYEMQELKRKGFIYFGIGRS
ncbi:MAG: UDP-glucose/GDP-mannose dehydrogenase family protein [Candidatus Desulfofervidaceae bacterium]|nr:UDP-glucose/GDP-mannose dehydrogenase family protein [Candidatus Desulfofervidaceae bacterium]